MKKYRVTYTKRSGGRFTSIFIQKSKADVLAYCEGARYEVESIEYIGCDEPYMVLPEFGGR